MWIKVHANRCNECANKRASVPATAYNEVRKSTPWSLLEKRDSKTRKNTAGVFFPSVCRCNGGVVASVFRSGTCLHDKRGHWYLHLEGKYEGNRASRRVQLSRDLFDTRASLIIGWTRIIKFCFPRLPAFGVNLNRW